MKNLEYRPDIDGLRAIAVMLVVIFHAGLNFIPGGYIGVDVFFVISGYLITGILIKDIERNKFSFSKFYIRRIRRLIPVLIFVLIITSILSVFILLPGDLIAYGKSLIAVLFSVSNIYFWRANGGYFEGNVQEVPLLHTWSLSVEEQFYLLWPLFLILFSGYLHNKSFQFLLIIVFLCGVYLSQWVSEITFGAAYYLLPTRAFELLGGALLAIFWNRIQINNIIVLNILSLLGLMLIVYPAIYLNEGSVFPGYNALIPTLGAMLLIYSGGRPGNYVSKIWSQRPFVFIGLISYSLYLWHWPVAVFFRYLGVEFTVFVSIAIIVISMVLAYFSWKYVEQFFRFGNEEKFFKVFKKLYLVPSVALISFSVALISFNGFPVRYGQDVYEMEVAVSSKPSELRQGCHSPSRNSEALPNESCQLGDTSSFRHALLIGDSHSNHLTGFMDEIGKMNDLKIMDYTLDECLPVFNLFWGHNNHYSKLCKKRNDSVVKYLKNNQFDFVILAGHWPTLNRHRYAYENDKEIQQEFFKDYFYERIFETVNQIKKTGAIAVIVKDTASNGEGGPKCSIKEHAFNLDLNCDNQAQSIAVRDEMINEIFSKIKSNIPDVILIDPKIVMCDDERCVSQLGGIPLFLDKNHLNDAGSRKMAEQYMKITQSPFSQ